MCACAQASLETKDLYRAFLLQDYLAFSYLVRSQTLLSSRFRDLHQIFLPPEG